MPRKFFLKSSEKGAAIDSFYATDEAGKKLRGEGNLDRLQSALRNAAQTLAG